MSRDRGKGVLRTRPAFAAVPGPGQESVWDYPRPPVVVPDGREVTVHAGSVEIARSRAALRVLETASPPTFYLPLADVHRDFLEPAAGRSVCEWKGEARYWSVVTDAVRCERAAWSYPATASSIRPSFAVRSARASRICGISSCC